MYVSNNNFFKNYPVEYSDVQQKEFQSYKQGNSIEDDYVEINGKKKTNRYSVDDGKISFGDKVKNFAKGLVSPITTMFKSPKNLLIGAVSIAAVTGLTIATGGAIAPLLVAGGVVGGGIQFITSAHKAKNAKTDDEAREAWQGIGAGTSTVAGSVIASKGALKAAKVDTSNMGYLKSTLECFKQVPKSVSKSINTISTSPLAIKVKNLFNNKSVQQEKNISKKPVETPKVEKKPNPKVDVYEDDRVFAYDGYDEGSALRDEMRERILSGTGTNDEALAVKSLDNPSGKTPQLQEGSKYFDLGIPRKNDKTSQYNYICENLRDMPDGNGVRGKNPLFGKNENGIAFRLKKIKESGIKRIIDLRAEGECSSKAFKVIQSTDMEYVNFPVEDGVWTPDKLTGLTKYIKAVNSGDFYVGCANGEARTDLAVAINYITNPNAKKVPELYFGTASSSRVSIKTNLSQILDLIKGNPDIVKEWGWNSYSEFAQSASQRLTSILATIQNK